MIFGTIGANYQHRITSHVHILTVEILLLNIHWLTSSQHFCVPQCFCSSWNFTAVWLCRLKVSLATRPEKHLVELMINQRNIYAPMGMMVRSIEWNLLIGTSYFVHCKEIVFLSEVKNALVLHWSVLCREAVPFSEGPLLEVPLYILGSGTYSAPMGVTSAAHRQMHPRASSINCSDLQPCPSMSSSRRHLSIRD